MSHNVRVAGFVAAVVLVAGCSTSTHHLSSSSTTGAGQASSNPGGSSSSTNEGAGGGSANGSIVFKASGPATAQAIDIDVNNQTYNAMQAVKLPWTTTVQFQAGFTAYALRVQSASATPPPKCEIDVPGQPPVTLTAAAGQSVVICQTG